MLVLPACDLGTSEPFVRRTLGFTFERTIDPWRPDGADLDEPPVTWSIERTDAFANQGDWSVGYHLENLNDAGKIWIETAVSGLTPGIAYDVRIAFDFGSGDGAVNAWQILAGASDADPESIQDLTVRGSTESPAGAGAFAWSRKAYEATVTTTDGVLWIAIGVWGTSEFTRDYGVDQVDVEVVRGG